MTCWEYPNNWPKLNPKVDELLTRSRRGAELTREGLRTVFIVWKVFLRRPRNGGLGNERYIETG